MKKTLLAIAAGTTIALSTGAMVSSAEAGVVPDPSPVPTQFGGNPCQIDGHGPSVNPQFGVDGRGCPRPTPRSCDRIRFVQPTDGGSGYPGRPAPEASVALTAKITHTGNVPTPRPTIDPRVRCLPEHFNVAEVLAGPNLSTVVADYAAATGPVSGVGTDNLATQTNTFDRFDLPLGHVNVRHTGIANPIRNINNCTVSELQFGVWSYNGGTLAYRNAIGNGTFRLALLAHFPVLRNGVCSLQLLSGNPLLQHRISPDFLSVAVHGDGVAAR